MNNIKVDRTGILAVFVTILGWSSAGIFINLLPNLDVLYIVSIRLMISLFIIFPLLFILKKNIISYLKELKNINTWLLGLVLFFCYLFGTLAFQMAPVGEVTILMTLSPLFVIIFKLFIGDLVKKVEIIGVFLALIGVFFITFNQLSLEEFSSSSRLIGNIIALMVSVFLALYAMWSRSLNKKDKLPNTFSIAISTFIIGSFLFVFIMFKDRELMDSVEFEYISIIYLFAISIISTTIPTICYSIASKHLSPVITTSILLLQPLFAMILAALFINEIPSLLVLPGFIFILIGLLFIIYTKKRSPKE